MLNLELPLFAEMALLIGFAAAIGTVGAVLRQPLVVSFIAAGLLAGPDVLGLVQTRAPIQLLADFGVAVLLFLVGLKLDLRTVRTLGTVAVVTGLGQVLFTSAIGLLICLLLGMGRVEAVYVAIALTFSSTIIIIKLLTDKREIDSLHGRIALGFLIVQDVVVVLAIVVLAATGIETGPDAEGPSPVATMLRGTALVVGVLVIARPLAERATGVLARSPELLATTAIAWTLLLSAAAEWAGLGKELGGLLAGAALGSTSVRDAIAARLAGLRDFLLLFFFLALGATLDLDVLAARIPAALVLSAFVLVGNPLIVMALMGWLGYRGRTSLLAGLTVAQISEFSLIFVGMAAAVGHVDEGAVGLVTLVGLITITGSTYLILYSHRLVDVLGRGARLFERRMPHREQDEGEARRDRVDVLLIGLGRYGGRIARQLHARGRAVLAVDFDPVLVRTARAEGLDAVYGDATDPELLDHLPPELGAVVIAVPPRFTASLETDVHGVLVRAFRDRYPGAPIAVTVASPADAAALHALGATITLNPFEDAADLAVEHVDRVLAGAPVPAATT